MNATSQTAPAQHAKPAPKRTRRWFVRSVQIVAGVVALGGLALTGIAIFAPSVADQLYEGYLNAERGAGQQLVAAGVLTEPVSISQINVLQPSGATGTPGPQADYVGSSYTQNAAGDYLPTVYFGGLGDDTLLDACDGSFTELEQYRTGSDVLPVFAAHNSCGGATILDIEIGDKVRGVSSSGASQTYVVTDHRDVAKVGSTTADLEGMNGEISLQTCYFSSSNMRFLALTPAP